MSSFEKKFTERCGSFKGKQSIEMVSGLESISSCENIQKSQEGPKLLLYPEDYLNALSLISKSQTTSSPTHKTIKIFSLSALYCVFK